MAKQAIQPKKVYHLLADKREDVLLLVGEHEGDGDENKKGGRRRMSREDERRKNGRI